MPVAKLTCPECSAVLKPAKPVPEGKKIKCPKCSAIFEARADEDDAPAPKPAAKKPAAAAKKPASPIAAKKPAAPAKPKPAAPAPAKKIAAYSDDEDDDGGTYGVIKEPEDEKKDDDEADDEGKPDLEFLPDLSIKDPRGPAQKAVIGPSNFLIGAGAITSILGLLFVGWAIWPMIFADHILEPKDVLMDPNKKTEPLNKEWKDLTDPQRAELQDKEDLAYEQHWWTLGAAIFAFFYGGFIAYGGVKMQMLESYPWAMTAAIMGMVPSGAPLGIYLGMNYGFEEVIMGLIAGNASWLLTLPAGMLSLAILKRPEIKAGYYVKVD